MRVLHVIASVAPSYGGPSTAVLGMAEATARRGHHVEIYTTDIDGSDRVDVPIGTATPVGGGAKITYFRGWPPGSFKPSPQLARALMMALPSFDVVHVHSLYLFHTAVSAALARRHGVPYVLRPHGALTAYHLRRHTGRKAAYDFLMERRNLRSAAFVHCTSDQERDAIFKFDPMLRTRVVPLGVWPGPWRENSRSNEGDKVVLFLGRITPKKNPVRAVEAFAAAARDLPEWRMVFAGPDSDGLYAAVSYRAASLGVSGRISYMGTVTGQEKEKLWRDADVFVLPSADENFGLTAVEAMGHGVPVVMTPSVGVAGDAAAAGAALVTDPEPDALMIALRMFMEDDGRRAKAGAAGRQLVEDRFAWHHVAEQLERMYVEAVGTPAREKPA